MYCLYWKSEDFFNNHNMKSDSFLSVVKIIRACLRLEGRGFSSHGRNIWEPEYPCSQGDLGIHYDPTFSFSRKVSDRINHSHLKQIPVEGFVVLNNSKVFTIMLLNLALIISVY